ncbi:MAG: hypothetical protein U0271_04005 [Polyangiaceae bacterium]
MILPSCVLFHDGTQGGGGSGGAGATAPGGAGGGGVGGSGGAPTMCPTQDLSQLITTANTPTPSLSIGRAAISPTNGHTILAGAHVGALAYNNNTEFLLASDDPTRTSCSS